MYSFIYLFTRLGFLFRAGKSLARWRLCVCPKATCFKACELFGLVRCNSVVFRVRGSEGVLVHIYKALRTLKFKFYSSTLYSCQLYDISAYVMIVSSLLLGWTIL